MLINISHNGIHDVFMKPAVRDNIENDQYNREKKIEIQLIINMGKKLII